ncbi:hypothetical protein [Streptomyces luteireticuli]|uniref:hypothetical protein n=1 Tax=Streptomyces luteireticuli TaxID=173858 RepID=UPI003558370C
MRLTRELTRALSRAASECTGSPVDRQGVLSWLGPEGSAALVGAAITVKIDTPSGSAHAAAHCPNVNVWEVVNVALRPEGDVTAERCDEVYRFATELAQAFASAFAECTGVSVTKRHIWWWLGPQASGALVGAALTAKAGAPF